jgi:hypothetical protein
LMSRHWHKAHSIEEPNARQRGVSEAAAGAEGALGPVSNCSNPKTETRNPKEIRNPKSEGTAAAAGYWPPG